MRTSNLLLQLQESNEDSEIDLGADFALEAIHCELIIMSSPEMPKQVYNEEVILPISVKDTSVILEKSSLLSSWIFSGFYLSFDFLQVIERMVTFVKKQSYENIFPVFDSSSTFAEKMEHKKQGE